MRLATLIAWEIRSSVRRVIPSEILRRGMIVFMVLGVAVISVAASGARGVKGRLVAISIGSLAGFSAVTIGLCVSVALLGGAALLWQPTRARLFQIAPVSDVTRIVVPLGAVVVLSALPWAFFAAPILVGTMRFAPATAALVLMMGAITVAWAFVVAGAILVGLSWWTGREKAGRIASASAGILAFLSMWGFGRIVRWTVQPITMWTVIAVTTLILPALTFVVARAFVSELASPDAPRTLPEPDWGHPGWFRIVARTSAPWAIAGLIPAVIVLLTQPVPLRWGIASVLLLTTSIAPQSPLWAAEYARPERWRMAPYGKNLRRSLLLRVGGTMSVVVLVLAGTIGLRHADWFGATAVILLLAPCTFLLRQAWLRSLTQGALFAAGLLSGALAQ